MSELSLANLQPSAAEKIRPFLDGLLDRYRENIHSLHITGTAITDDYHDNLSDINSIVVLKKMDLQFLKLLAPMGRTYGKDRVAAPLIMTPEYIAKSIDVFPLEFLSFKLIHSTVFGEDILRDIEISRKDLRHQCERELKTKLIWLRQGYISSEGDRNVLKEGFINSITGYIPLFRGIIFLYGRVPPVRQREVITVLSEAAQINTDIFAKVLEQKHDRTEPTAEELTAIFEDYYTATERLENSVDNINEG